MILYIHGFASCGDSNKTRLLKNYFPDVYAPDIPVDPYEAIPFLEGVVRKQEIRLLMGSSLGGFYAAYLAQKFEIKTVLLNPSIQPFITLAPLVGRHTFYCSDETFEWKKEYIHSLMSYAISKNSIKVPVLVLLQKGDEVLDFQKAATFYDGYEVVIQEGGNHRFENLEDYVAKIEAFMRQEP